MMMSKWWHLKLSGISIALYHTNHFKAPSTCTLRGWDLKAWAFSLAGSLICMHVHSIPLYTRPCNLRAQPFLLGLNDYMLKWPFMDPMRNDYDKLLVKITSYISPSERWDLKLSFCGPHANELSSIVVHAFLFTIIPVDILGRFTPRGWANSHWGQLHDISALFGLDAGLNYTLW